MLRPALRRLPPWLVAAAAGWLAAAGAFALPAGPPPPVASYQLEAALDPSTHQVRGQGTLTWRNTSRTAVDEIYLHLYLNAFRNTASTWLKGAEGSVIETLADGGWGWIELDRLATADGVDLLRDLAFAAPDDGNPEDRTLARVPLPEPVPPGGTLELVMAFRSQLPRAVARTGFKNDYHLVAQWFPKVAVLEPSGSWNAHQFHRSSEFFADFGRYDVTLLVPEEVVVGATGQLAQPPRKTESGLVAHRYVQSDPPVHDFAWTAWPGFVRRVHRFEHEELPPVEITLLLRPDTTHLEARYLAALEHGLRLFGGWFGAYPYETLTLVDPPWGADATGGMEYPTFILAGTSILAPPATLRPEGVTIHELGHQWWYGLIATDEMQESYLDEGITTWATGRVLAEAYGPRAFSIEAFGLPLVVPGLALEHSRDTSARYFEAPSTDPIARTSWGYLDRGAYRRMTYSKMALAMEQLRRTLGADTFDRALRTYAERYRFRHPKTADFVRTFEESAGRDLEPFFDQVLFGAEVLDYAVAEISSRRRRGPLGVFAVDEPAARTAEPLPGWESEVVVRRLGGVQLPVTVELVFEGGQTSRREWDGRDRWVRYRVTGPKLVSAEVDPDDVLVLDLDPVNDRLTTERQPHAARRWGQVLRFWLQNVLELFAAFA